MSSQNGDEKTPSTPFQTTTNEGHPLLKSVVMPPNKSPVNAEKSLNAEPDLNGPPKDHFYLALIICFLQGAGTLFPWNAFISAPDYFISIYGKNALIFFSVAYSWPNVFGLIMMTLFGSRIPALVKSIPTYALMLGILIAIPIMAVIPITSSRTLADSIPGLIITLSFLFLCGLSTAAVQGGVFGLAGIMPGKYMTAVMSGNGLAGLSVSILRVITKAAVERHEGSRTESKISTIIFFSVSSIVIVLCILTFFVFLRLPIVRYYIQQSSTDTGDNNEEYENVEDDDVDDLFKAPTMDQSSPTKESESPLQTIESKPQKGKLDFFYSALRVLKSIWIDALGIFVTFAVTLSIFPGLCVLIPTRWPQSFLRNWLGIFMVVTFNLFDTIGRTFPMVSDRINQFCYRFIHIPVVLRLLFIPMFILCLRWWDKVGPIINFDPIPLMFMALMSFTNGYFSSLLMRFAPTKVLSRDGQTASIMMTSSLVVGIVAGSNMGMIISASLGLFSLK